MKIKIYLLLLIISFFNNLSAEDDDQKFPLNKIGIKIKKPINYFLLTSENVNKFRKELINRIDVCNESKLAVEQIINNSNYQILVNENNYNETITFNRLSSPADGNLDDLLREKVGEQCVSIKNSKIDHIKSKKGSTKIGSYVSILNKITNENLFYYSEVYVFESRNSIIGLTINRIDNISNVDFVKNIEFINNEKYEKIIYEFEELIQKNDFSNAGAKINEAI
jgi:hypothetical protein